MNICIVCNEYPPNEHGGIGTFTQMFARDLVSYGHKVYIVGLYEKSLKNNRIEIDRGVIVYRINKYTGIFNGFRSRLKLFILIKHLTTKLEIDLIEIPDWEGWAAFWPSLTVPVIIRLHGTSSLINSKTNKKINRKYYLLEKASLLRADAFIAVSSYVAQNTEKLYKIKLRNMQIIYNYINIELPAIKRKTIQGKVVFSGTLNENKGIINLVLSWGKIFAIYPKSKLHVYGKDGSLYGISMKAYLEDIIKVNKLKNIYFHGHVSRNRLFESYFSANVAVFPSYSESFAFAPLESMYCGCATIYTILSSGKELIPNNKIGILINPNNIDEISEAIIKLIKDVNSAIQMGKNSQNYIRKKFTKEVMINKNIKYYKEILNENY
jgi:glycosyltransferase involved in cell wall biosynthesis